MRRGAGRRVVVVAIHFGPLPATFSLWLKSVTANEATDFLLFTDQEVAPVPANLRAIRSSLAAIRRRAEAVLEVPVALDRPYKLCDLRPMYGVVFAEEIGTADYWGHCDLDLMFGRIASMITDEAWTFDKILVRGNFSLYRNTDAMNGMFRRGENMDPSLDWRRVLASPDNRLFDEWAGIYRIITGSGVAIFQDEVIADIDRARHWLRRTRATRETVQEVFYWQDGRIFGVSFSADGSSAVDEYLLIHLQKRKLRPPDPSVLDAERIYLVPTGFVAGEAEAVDLALARRINPSSLLGDARIFGRRTANAIRRKMRPVLP